MKKKLRELLYRSFDSPLSQDEEKKLEEAIQKSKELRDEQEKIAKMRKIIENSSKESFQPLFADNVLRNLRYSQESTNGMEAFFDSLVAAFRPVAIAAGIALLLLISYNLTKSNKLTFASAIGEPEVTLEEVLDPSLTIMQEWK